MIRLPREDRWLVLPLASCLLAFAGAKLLWGWQPDLQISAPVYWTATAVELGAAALLLGGRDVAGATLAALFLLVATVWSWATGLERCGCLGPVALPASAYRMIAASLGLLAALLLLRRGARR